MMASKNINVDLHYRKEIKTQFKKKTLPLKKGFVPLQTHCIGPRTTSYEDLTLKLLFKKGRKNIDIQ